MGVAPAISDANNLICLLGEVKRGPDPFGDLSTGGG